MIVINPFCNDMLCTVAPEGPNIFVYHLKTPNIKMVNFFNRGFHFGF